MESKFKKRDMMLIRRRGNRRFYSDYYELQKQMYDFLYTDNKKINNLERYIINKDATILFWKNGDKTVVKKTKKDKFDKRLGFLYAWFQATSGLSKSKANEYLENLEEEVK